METRSLVVLRGIVSAGLIKGLSMLVSLGLLPAYLNFFESKSTLGVWLAAVSVVTWVLSLDLGLGNGMRNGLVASVENESWDRARRQILGAYGAATALVLVFGVLALSISLVTGSYSLRSLTGDQSADTLDGPITWLVATIGLQFVLRNATFICYALQRSAINNAISLATTVLLLVFVLGDTYLPGGPHLAVLGPAYFVAVNAPLVMVTIWLFIGPLRRCRPWTFRGDLAAISDAFRSGGPFFANQVLYTALLGSSTVFVLVVADPEGVVSFQAQYALFSISGILATLALTPVWSAATQALVVRDFTWARKALRVSELVGLAVCVLPVATALGLDYLLAIWLGVGVIPSNMLEKSAFVLFAWGFVLHAVVATFAAGFGRLRLQLAYYVGGFSCKVVIVWFVAPQTDEWAIVPALDGLVLLMYFFAQRRVLRRWLAAQAAEAAVPHVGEYGR